MKENSILICFLLLILYLQVSCANNISEQQEQQIGRNITNLVGKKLLAKVDYICFETPSEDFTMGAEIFQEINIGKKYITTTEKQVETITRKESETIVNRYSQEQRFLYEIKEDKIILNCKNEQERSDYKLLSLELKDEKIIAHLKIIKNTEVECWEDLTSIYNQELVAQIDTVKYDVGKTKAVFMKVKFIKDDILVSIGTVRHPRKTAEYGNFKKYSYTQQKTYIKTHFTSEQKKEKGYKLLILSVTDGKLWGVVKMNDNKEKEVEFVQNNN